ncbi:PD-(D/E)XK nuclease family protein [Rhizobium sp. ARZ01]|nr:PD-(D/E)XK nuclease family protein [Rhizobium sp. ARZ01]
MTVQLIDRLPQLLQSLKASFAEGACDTRPHENIAVPDPVRLQSILASVRSPLADAQSNGFLADPFHALKLGRDEVRNAHLLAWFLLWRSHHGLGPRLLDSLIGIVARELGIPPITSSKHCVVTTEALADGGRENRVDILINDPSIFAIIEVKIDAKEQASQLDRYCEIAKRRSGGGRGRLSISHQMAELGPRVPSRPKKSFNSPGLISLGLPGLLSEKWTDRE